MRFLNYLINARIAESKDAPKSIISTKIVIIIQEKIFAFSAGNVIIKFTTSFCQKGGSLLPRRLPACFLWSIIGLNTTQNLVSYERNEDLKLKNTEINGVSPDSLLIRRRCGAGLPP